VLVSEQGKILTAASFAPGVTWQPGEIVALGLSQRYRILERRDEHGTVTLIVTRLP
jgi:hypothetical protein